MSIQYLADVESFEVVNKPVKRRGTVFLQLLPGQSPSGYGAKISTDKMVRINNRLYRVYTTCFSNVASHWIKKNGNKFYFRDGDFT